MAFLFCNDYMCDGEVEKSPESEHLQAIEMYQSYESLNIMLTSHGSQEVPFVLINSNYIIQRTKEEMDPLERKELPSEAIYHGRLNDDVVVLVMPYGRVKKRSIEESRPIMKELVVFLEFLEETRHVISRDGKKHGIGNKKVVLFLDYMSMFQIPRTAKEQSSFDKALEFMNIWYVHTSTWVLLDTTSDQRERWYSWFPNQELTPENSWELFEYHLSNMLRKEEKVIDFPTAISLIKDLRNTGSKKYMDFFFLLQRGREQNMISPRKLPLTPEKFDDHFAKMDSKRDKTVNFRKRKYLETYTHVMMTSESLLLQHMNAVSWSEWAPYIHDLGSKVGVLRVLDLSFNPSIVATLAVLKPLVNLVDVNLYNCSGITGSLDVFVGLPQISRIIVAGCFRLTGRIDSLITLDTLDVLDLECCMGLTLDGATLEALVETLTQLNVHTTKYLAENHASLEQKGSHDSGWGKCVVGRIADGTPLYYAAFYGQEQLVCDLLELDGIDVDVGTRSTGYTALHIASHFGYVNIVNSLLMDSTANSDKQVNDGRTSLYIACRNGYLDIAKLLVGDGHADVEKASNEGWTPLWIASRNGHLDIVEFLLSQHAAEANIAANDGSTCVYVASQEGHLDVVKFLVQTSKADPSVAQNSGGTPLYVASQQGHADVVKFLVGHAKVDVDAPVKAGFTPLYVACQEGHLDVVKCLIVDGKADSKKAAKKSGRQALSKITLKRKHNNIFIYLAEQGAIKATKKKIKNLKKQSSS